jgi:hypothetical protein
MHGALEGLNHHGSLPPLDALLAPGQKKALPVELTSQARAIAWGDKGAGDVRMRVGVGAGQWVGHNPSYSLLRGGVNETRVRVGVG